MPATLDQPVTTTPAAAVSAPVASTPAPVVPAATTPAATTPAAPVIATTPAPAPAAAPERASLLADAAAPNAPAAPAPKVEDSAPSVVYNLKAPDKSALTAAHLTEIEAFAKERKISPEAAQAIVERESKLIEGAITAQNEKARTDLTALTATWKDQARNDPTIGGPKWNDTVKMVDRALVNEPALYDLLKSSGFSHHPVVVAFLARQGAKTMEMAPPAGAGVPPKAEKPLTHVMFPSSYPTTAPT